MDYIKQKKNWMPSLEMEKIQLNSNQIQNCFLVRIPGQKPDIELQLPDIVTGYKEKVEKCSKTDANQHKTEYNNFTLKFLFNYNMFKLKFYLQKIN